MTGLRAIHSFVGVLTTLATLIAFRVEIRNWLEGLDTSLGLALPVLASAAALVGVSAAVGSLVLECAALMLTLLALTEIGLTLPIGAILAGLIAMLALDGLSLRVTRPED